MSISLKIKRIVLDCLIIIITLCFIFSIYCFFSKSFELYPTEEQIEKVKIVSAFFGIISLIIDITLIKFREKMFKKEN